MHTPGPWKYAAPLGEGFPSVLSEHVNAGGNFYVAQCNVEDDARLIAAAPALRAALDLCVRQLETLDNTIPFLDDARAALKMARGEG